MFDIPIFAALFSWVARADTPLVPRWDAPRTFKIDRFLFASSGLPFYAPSHQWTLILRCTPMGARTESCSFVDGVWSTYSGEESQKLPAPGTLEFTWTERGRLSTWDVRGDRRAFRSLAEDIFVDKPDWRLSADRRREIGAELEGELVSSVASALDWELPKDGVGRTWTTTQVPIVARWMFEALSQGSLSVTATDVPGGVSLAVAGQVNDFGSNSSGRRGFVQTRVRGAAVFDPEVGRIITARYETFTTSEDGLVGFTRSMTLVAPWSEGEPNEPAPLPERWLTDRE